MVRRWGLLILAIVMALSLVSVAQEAEKPKAAPEKQTWSFYKLDLTVKELDGTKVVNSRTYTLSGRGDEWTRIRIGSKIPITNEKMGTQYMDIGLNVDARILEYEGGPALSWIIDFSSVAAEAVASGQPVVRSVRSQGYSPLIMGKPVLLSSSDDLNSSHKFVFEVTANKVR